MLEFITFGSHGQYIDYGKRLTSQINALQIFDTATLYHSNDLKKDDHFWNRHKLFIERNRRGYGYWLWKPYLIKKRMEQMKDGDILLYLDSECKINLDAKDLIMKCIEAVKDDLIIGTWTPREDMWNKMDLLLRLDMNHPEYLSTPQHQGGLILLLVCEATRRLVNEWYDIGCDYHMIDDTPSIQKNHNSFREHRHDQSIFSLLTKKYNMYSKMNITEYGFRI